MQPTTPTNAPDSLSTDNTTQPQKTNQPEPSTDHTPNFIDILEQTKTWMSMIPDVFISEIRGFFEAVKCSNSVDVYDRHKVQIEYDTLQFSNTINKSATQKSLRITNFKLGLIRNMIYLYLAFNRKADYRKSWTSIAYTVLTLGLNEEENFCIFAHLLENVLSGFFLALKNYQKKRETVADFYLLAELKSYIFPAISSSSLDLKAMKTLPNYSKNHKNKSNTFAGLFHIPKIFRGKPQSISISNTSQNPNMSLQRIDPVSPKSSHIKNYELFCLLQAVADVWFGTLFTNILSLNETLELWDYLFRYGNNFLYQFSLALLTQADLKLATIIKKEKMTYFSMGIEDPQSIFSMLLPSIKKTLKTSLTPSEFQATLKMAKTLETFVKDNRELMEVKRKQIVKTTQAERVRRLLVTRRELETKGPLSEHRVKAIIRSIDEYDAETFLLQDILNILKKEQVVSPYLGSKIFSFIDSSLKGLLEPIELRIFFIMLTETPRKKLQLLWEELSNKKPIISVDEAIKVLQVIDQFIIPNSSQIDEKVADIYQTWIRVLPDDNVPIKDFVEFFQKCKACKSLLTILETIDGTVPLKSELSFDDREPLQTRGTTRQQEKNFESFIDFSINDEFGKTQQDDAKSKSDISLVVDHVIEGRLSSKENRNENDQEHENSVGNIVTLFDSARNKIKNFARSLSANRSNGSARTNPIQNHCPMSKSSGVPEKFVLLGETDLPQHQAAPVK